ncbi:hypothetical protein B0H21DRAFT_712848 [Amylocystis lapponica]|nr:hypothetical protein B0H21DRAFT_712848 [Amylocystis lapponica]
MPFAARRPLAMQIPDNTKLQKEVVLSLMKASTASPAPSRCSRAPADDSPGATAHDVASSKQHKSISASDVLKALEMLGFGDMVPSLQDELQIYRDIQKADKGKRGEGAKGKAREAEPRAKGKGKERENEGERGPTITIAPPAAQGRAEPVEDEAQMESDGDDENDEGVQGGDEEMQDRDEDAEMGVVDADEDEDEDEDGSGPDDIMAVENEELRRDAHALDDA